MESAERPSMCARSLLRALVVCRILYSLVQVDTAVGELAERSLGLKGYNKQDTMSADILSSTPLCGLSTGFHPFRRVVVPAAASGSCANC